MDNEREGGHERWAPTRDVTGHDGGPLPADLCFFEAPPPEIGPVLTAYSTMSARRAPLLRYGAVILSAAAGFGVALWLVDVVGIERWLWRGAALFFATLLSVFVAFLFVGNKRECSYVGRDGVARFRTGLGGHLKPDLVFLFRDIARLEAESVKNLYSGRYSFTTYTFRWLLHDGSARKVEGTHNSERGEVQDVGPAHVFTFCRAAAAAWERYQADRAPGPKVGSDR